MKPLFLTFSNSREPYLSLAKRLEEDVKRFDAGDFQLVMVNSPGENADFFTVSACLVYSYIIKAINLRPLIVLDCDNEIKKPLPNFFETDWDIAACYRGRRRNENGLQYYNAGLVALNNKRPDTIRKFWVEWINKAELWEKPDTIFFPETLKTDGWKQSWYSKQSALNQIILPERKESSRNIVLGQPYASHDYKILPLNPVLYGTQLGKETEDTFIIHHKGGTKRE